MKISTRTRRLGLVAAMAVLQMASTVSADEGCDEGRHGHGKRHAPPAEALDACSDAEEGAACSFVGRRDREITGTCEILRDDLACVPEGHWRHGPREDESES